MTESVIFWISTIGSILGLITSIYFFYDRSLSKKKEIYMTIRDFAKKNRHQLCDEILNNYKFKYYGNTENHLISKDDWFPTKPLIIDDNFIQFSNANKDQLIKVENAITLPNGNKNEKLSLLSDSIKIIEQPKNLSNREHYRLINLSGKDTPLFEYSNEKARYFDKINYGGLLEYEYAKHRYLKNRSFLTFSRLTNRNKLKNCDNIFNRIKILTGISTLTFLKDGDNLRFLIHERGKTAYANGVFHVIPAGEFQPENDAPLAFKNDFSWWKNIMREYAEEVGGKKEFDGNKASKADYNTAPFNELQKAIDSKKASIYYVGFGLDPLTLQGEILTISVFDYDTFTSIFPKIIDENDEGKIYNESKEKWGYPYENEVIDEFLSDSKNTLQAGKALLKLSKKHIQFLIEN